jgi:hypothetical protein
MTTTDLSIRDRRVILRMLWAFYIGALLVAVGFFARFVVAGSGTSLFAALAACLAAWFVTNPLDELRRDGTS